MTYRDILVYVDNSPCSATRVALAVGLAQRHKAHLTGLYVISHSHYQSEHGNSELDAELAQANFELETTQTGIEAEWLCVEGSVSGINVAEIVCRYAYFNDLVIVGQPGPDNIGDSTPFDLPQLIAASGRPILIIPHNGTFTSVGERIVVGWHSGRGSVRALNDAMPLLEMAMQVGVMTVTHCNKDESSDSNGCTEICTYLSHHGITAKTEQFVAEEVSIGDVVLNQAWEDGSDLLVMGAYTHTKWGFFTVGPVASYVLSHMTIPVLMSH